MANIISIRQKQPLGLGHAVLCGQPVIGNSPFAVLLGDEIMVTRDGGPNVIGQLSQRFNEVKSSVVAIMKVLDKDVSKYGIADVEPYSDSLYKVKSFVEKPSPEKTPSRWAMPGRYVFTSDIFSELKNGKAGNGGEIQLTDSMNHLAQKQSFYASTFTSDRFDAGDKFGYLKANIELSLRNLELESEMKKYIATLATRIDAGEFK
jgi:UTP--glucose-1-phosphate uridylyltransferase